MRKVMLLVLVLLAAGGCQKSSEDRVQEYIEALRQGPNDARLAAVRELAQMGPAAAPAVEDLIAVMNRGGSLFDPLVVETSTALENIGPAAVEPLRKMVAEKSGKWGVAQTILKKLNPAAAK